MRHFGNFMFKQQLETKRALVESFKKNNSDRTKLLEYKIFLKDLDYKELMKLAKSTGVPIPVPSNY